MDHHIEQLTNAFKDIRLSSSEKETARRSLRAYMTLHPPRPAGAWQFFMRHAAVYSAAVLLVMAGSTTVLAQQSLPGDLLYPMKRGVNDRVAVAIAGDEDARLDVELQQLDRVVEEESLAADRQLGQQRSDEAEQEQEEDIRGALSSDDRLASPSASSAPGPNLMNSEVEDDFEPPSSISKSGDDHLDRGGRRNKEDASQEQERED